MPRAHELATRRRAGQLSVQTRQRQPTSRGCSPGSPSRLIPCDGRRQDGATRALSAPVPAVAAAGTGGPTGHLPAATRGPGRPAGRWSKARRSARPPPRSIHDSRPGRRGSSRTPPSQRRRQWAGMGSTRSLPPASRSVRSLAPNRCVEIIPYRVSWTGGDPAAPATAAERIAPSPTDAS